VPRGPVGAAAYGFPMDLASAVELAERLVAEHGLTGWQVRLDHARRRAGVCHFGPRTIGLSAPITRITDEDAVRDTILHEIAHALAGPRHGHDAHWRRVARQIGCSGERCVAADAPAVETPWVGVCAAGHQVGRHRRPERVMTCSQCSPRFDLAHVFTWTHRGRVASPHPNYQAELASLLQGGRMVLLSAGSRVRVTGAAGEEYAGLTGRVVRQGRTRYLIRLAGRAGALRVPFAWVEPLR
jgi:predicted SprT family Zn-dependent metalloprotease